MKCLTQLHVYSFASCSRRKASRRRRSYCRQLLPISLRLALNIYHKRVKVILVVTMWALLYLAWHFHMVYFQQMDFSGGSVVKKPPASAEDAGSLPGPGRFPGEGNGNPLQYSCPANPMDRGA